MSTTVITALIWRAESSFATYQASFRSGLRIVGNVRLLISIITPKQAERNARVVRVAQNAPKVKNLLGDLFL